MKFSKTFRWILAVVVSTTVFAEEFIYYRKMLENNSVILACLIFAVLVGIMIAPLQGGFRRRFILIITTLFVLSCLFPPWQDAHRGAVGYALIFDFSNDRHGYHIDFDRVLLEWAMLIAITGIVWLLKPEWLLGSKTQR